MKEKERRETISSKNGEYLKKSIEHLKRLSNFTKITEICQITNFDIGFQKNNILGRYKNVDF